MLKCSSDRCVCAPHSLSLGTSTSPRLSVSLRTLITFTLLIAFIVFSFWKLLCNRNIQFFEYVLRLPTMEGHGPPEIATFCATHVLIPLVPFRPNSAP